MRAIKFSILAFALFCFSTSVLAFDPFAPAFESLNLSAIQSQATSYPENSPERRVLELFLAEAYWFHQKIHSANETYRKIAEGCQILESPHADTSLVCAIAIANTVAHTASWKRAEKIAQIDSFINLAKSQNASQESFLFARAKISGLLPPAQGQDYGLSLLTWEMLKRLRPDAGSIDFWLGRIHQLVGNESNAIEHFNRALNRATPDERTRLFFGKNGFKRVPWHLDGLSYGIAPALFISPAEGFGGGVSAFDDRMYDKRRSVAASAFVTTESIFGIKTKYADEELFADSRVGVGFEYRHGLEQFYGFGIGAPASALQKLTIDRLYFGLNFEKQFWNYCLFSLGWNFHNWKAKIPVAGVVDPEKTFHSGPSVTLAFDNRDSRINPWRGTLVSVEGYFPTTGLGSDRSFERWKIDLAQYVFLSRKHQLGLRASTLSLKKDVPYGAIPKLSGSIDFPGVRLGRYQERNIFGGVLQYHWHLWQPASLVLFGLAGNVAPLWGDLFKSSMKFGGGGAIEFHFNNNRSKQLRVELASFNRETVLSALAAAQF